jgi:hypothetical protein
MRAAYLQTVSIIYRADFLVHDESRIYLQSKPSDLPWPFKVPDRTEILRERIAGGTAGLTTKRKNSPSRCRFLIDDSYGAVVGWVLAGSIIAAASLKIWVSS